MARRVTELPDQTGDIHFRMLFADLDGTLVKPDGTISARTLATLKRIERAGCILVVCTGRSRAGAEKISRLVGGRFGIVLNGAIVLEWKTGHILRCSLLPEDVVGAACKVAADHCMAPVWMGVETARDSVYVQSSSLLWPEYEHRNVDRIRYAADFSKLSELPASLAAYGTEHQAVGLARAWRNSLGARAIAVAGPTEIYHGWYAQITAAGADKAAAAAFLADHCGVPRKQTMAVGDHANDIELLRWSGYGICMGDGHPDARLAADYVAGLLERDGAASALEQILLKQPAS